VLRKKNKLKRSIKRKNYTGAAGRPVRERGRERAFRSWLFRREKKNRKRQVSEKHTSNRE